MLVNIVCKECLHYIFLTDIMPQCYDVDKFGTRNFLYCKQMHSKNIVINILIYSKICDKFKMHLHLNS